MMCQYQGQRIWAPFELESFLSRGYGPRAAITPEHNDLPPNLGSRILTSPRAAVECHRTETDSIEIVRYR
jgi:hypothetical protein